MPKDIIATSAGCDYRQLRLSHSIPKKITPTSTGGGVTGDEVDEQIDRLIQQMHCRLLEGATKTQTFVGDRIVRRFK